MRSFLMGNEVLAQAAFDAGAQIMFGYPITPTTEVFSTWVRLAEKNKRKYLQTEDEMAAGFGVCGSVLAGVPAFTATAGPGTVLMQDAISMAEGMRLPTVCLIGQRGGPSTGQVIYSQQELYLTAFGGNGEGLRLVYAPSSLQELYDLTLKTFANAWKYRFPTFILYDGYLGKMKGEVNINEKLKMKNEKIEPILTTNMRNCYNLEEEVYELNMRNFSDWQKMADEICEYEVSGKPAEKIIIAYGTVALAAKDAGVFLFRPKTLWPFPDEGLKKISKTVKKITIVESSLGQLSKLVRDKLQGWQGEIESIGKPALGFTPEEILEIYGA
ncbi:MAG: ferredoxin oxidoreductase [Patescibacteria group bacterium]